MSFPLNDTVEKNPLQESLTTDAWKQEIVPSLPKELEESAWRLGAMTRQGGKIQSASDLLRGVLVYAMCVTSFQALGAWGVISGVADLADTSWRERVRKSGAWLCWVLNELMRPEKQEPGPRLKKAGYGAIELVDASHLRCVGKKGKVIRFHCMYALLTQQLHQVVVSTTKVAESIASPTVPNMQVAKSLLLTSAPAMGSIGCMSSFPCLTLISPLIVMSLALTWGLIVQPSHRTVTSWETATGKKLTAAASASEKSFSPKEQSLPNDT